MTDTAVTAPATPGSVQPATRGTVRTELYGAVAHVVLDRPDTLNSITPDMFYDLVEAGQALAADESIRAIVLRGEGRGFCAGLDMGQFERIVAGNMAGEPLDIPGNASALAQQAVEIWSQVPVPVIAALHGPALGGGFQFALGADIRISAPDTKLSAMEVIWGIIPDMMGTQLLPRLIGPSKAKRLIFTADTISGEQGLEWGIVDELADDPRAAAHALAERIAGMSRSALVWSKRLVDMADTASLREGLAAEQQALSELRGTDEQKAAVEKRMGELAARKAAKAQA